MAIRKENMLWLQLPKKVYFKTGCTPVALRETVGSLWLQDELSFITDAVLYQAGRHATP